MKIKFWERQGKLTYRQLERKIATLEKQIEGGRGIIQRTSLKCNRLIQYAKQQEAHVQTMAAYMVAVLNLKFTRGTVWERAASEEYPWIIAKDDIAFALRTKKFIWKETDDKKYIKLWVENKPEPEPDADPEPKE